MQKITVAKAATAQIEEKKSVFIGSVSPVENENDAACFVNSVKKKYYDAKHNVFAYYIDNGNTARFTDDGEPKGSAGIPVLNVLKMSGATDMCVVVTRYFGGILLGTGGLVRAYGAAAKAALDNAGLAAWEMFDLVEVRCSYSDYQKLISQIQKVGATEENSEFSTDVLLKMSCKSSDTDALHFLVTEATSGRCAAVKTGETERKTELV